MRTIPCFIVSCALSLAAGPLVRADEPAVFSGPQVGEKLAPFQVTGVYGEYAGKKFDPVAAADGKPVLLVFVHTATRPSAALTRALLNYGEMRKEDGLYSAMVWLTDDVSEAERYLKTGTSWWGVHVPVGISLEGAEGPGSYGLNRSASLTVLVGKDNRVTANFALVQPSVTDAPGILAEVVKLIGGEPPTPQEADFLRFGAQIDPKLRGLIAKVIRAADDQKTLDQSVQAVERYVGEDPVKQRQLGEMASVLAQKRGAKYSPVTADAQKAVFRKWAEKYKSGADSRRTRGNRKQ